jgi:aspartyl-tRNA(Asn)/glutamyl-tRNA(Gln) amidotransferase subunit C
MPKKTKCWKIDKKLVDRVAKVSRVNLSDKEVEKFSKQFDDILKACKELDEVDTSDVEPSFHPVELKNVMRDDKSKPWKWDPLSNTEYKERKYFKGPRIV